MRPNRLNIIIIPTHIAEYSSAGKGWRNGRAAAELDSSPFLMLEATFYAFLSVSLLVLLHLLIARDVLLLLSGFLSLLVLESVLSDL